MAKKLRAIALDLDGTLTNTEPFYRQLMTLVLKHEFNYPLTKEEYDHYYFGKTTRQGFAEILKKIWGHPPSAEEVEEIIPKVVEQAIKLRQTVAAEIFPGAIELFAWCREHGVSTAIVTNASRKTVESNKDWYHWDELITKADHFVSYSDVGKPKPAPDSYLKAAELMGVDPSEMLVVEDTVHGVAAGIAAGAVTAGVNGLSGSDADYHFSSLSDLTDKLPELF